MVTVLLSTALKHFFHIILLFFHLVFKKWSRAILDFLPVEEINAAHWSENKPRLLTSLSLNIKLILNADTMHRVTFINTIQYRLIIGNLR